MLNVSVAVRRLRSLPHSPRALVLPRPSKPATPAPPRGGRRQEAARAEVPRRRGARRDQDAVLRPVRSAAGRPDGLHRCEGRATSSSATINDTEDEGEPHRVRSQRKLNRVNVAELPLDMAIKKVKGNGSRKMNVFSDADCPFCARLEQELKNVDNVTIYTFLYPIDSAAPGRRAQVAHDLVRAGPGARHGTRSSRAASCPTTTAIATTRSPKTAELGAEATSVNATPTLIFADGSRRRRARCPRSEARDGDQAARRRKRRSSPPPKKS